jgi:hypothetical protein
MFVRFDALGYSPMLASVTSDYELLGIPSIHLLTALSGKYGTHRIVALMTGILI